LSASHSPQPTGAMRPPQSDGLGLTGRVFLGTAAIVAVVIAAAFVITSASVRRAGEASAQRGLEQSADLVAQFLAGRSRSLTGGARVFVQGPYFRTLVAAERRDDILDQAIEASQQLGADWVFITDGRGVMLAKSDEPGASGQAMGAVPLVAGALRGLTTNGFGVTRDTLLFQAVAVPIATPAGTSIGVLVAARLVDSVLVRDVKATTSSDLLFYARKFNGDRAVSVSTLGAGTAVSRAVAALQEDGKAAGSAEPSIEIAGVPYLAQGSTLTTAGGEAVGGFVVLRSRDAELTGIANLRRSLAIAGVIGLLLSWLAAFIAARRVAEPVRTLAGVVRRAADGEYIAEMDGVVRSLGTGSEMRDLGDAFSSLISDLRDKQLLTGLAPPQAPEPHARTESAGAASRGASRLVIGGSAPRGAIELGAGAALDVGFVLANRYRVEATLGSGGLGVVYRVHDRVIGESVALKVLRRSAVSRDLQAPNLLAEELRVSRRITHRNVVRMHDIGEADGITFLTMELVDGASLAAIIESRGALQPAAVLSIARQLLRALSVMHAEGVVHGDLKPANLLLGPDGVLKVSDFGISRVVRSVRREGHGDEERAPARPDIAGAVIGTPEYMSPEQLIGAAPNMSSDIYAAGVVLHECLRGTTPFEAETRMTFIAHKLDTPGAATGRDTVQSHSTLTGLEAVVARMMAPSPDARPHSAAALLEELAQLD
jgi:eukaryotic-like serine/threonine-protein kinase